MKNLYSNFLALLLLCATTMGVKAQFAGQLAPANWGTTATNSDGITNTAGSPVSIYMTSGDNQSGMPGTNDFSITVPATGYITFAWDYSTLDGASWDYPQV